MEWVCKGMLTMASVALVLVLARRWGGNAAGLVAGLPTTTAPALGWMATAHGAGFAADAAVATVAACAVLAAFALAYAHATARHHGQPVALAWGAGAALVLTGSVLAIGSHLLAALALALVCCVAALLAWPASPSAGQRAARRDGGQSTACMWRSATLPASVAGAVSSGLALVGPAIGTVFAGLLASVPVVSITVAMAQHAVGGPAAARQFLHGTVAGLFGRVAFGTVFAVAVAAFGTAWALGLATVATGVVNLVCVRRLALVRRRATVRTAAAGFARLRSAE